MFNWHKKEKPLVNLYGLGGGAGGFAFGGAGGGTEATGGTKIEASDGYTYHFFTSTTPDTFVIGAELTFEFLSIAGGGAGGAQHGGGGGAGALYHNSSSTFSAGTYPVTIGSGGSGVATPPGNGNNGGDTVFGSYTLRGGGGGGNMTQPGQTGGSGGGGGMDTTGWPSGNHPNPNTPGASAVAPPNIPLSDSNLYVNGGGAGTAYYRYSAGGIGGGGGGAGGAGTKLPNGPGLNSPPSRGGNDFLWTSLPAPIIPDLAVELGTPTTFLGVPVGSPIDYLRAFGGGGAGGSHASWSIYNPGGQYPTGVGGGSPHMSGGLGGIGNSLAGSPPSVLPKPGATNRGAGGGGSGGAANVGGNGSDGIVIVRYAT